MNHLVIYNKKMFNQDYIASILSGSKILGMKFSMKKTAPYNKLKEGDCLYLKESSGPVRGRVYAHQIYNVEISDPEEVLHFLTTHSRAIGINNETQLMDIWRQNASKRYLCYWEMRSPEIIRHPVFIHKHDRRAWVAGYEPPEEVAIGFL